MLMVVPVSVIIVVSVFMAVVVVVLVLAVVVPVIGVHVLLAHFVAMKLPFPACVSAPIGSFAPMRIRPSVSEPWIICAVYISNKAHGTVKPGTRAEKHSANKPLRSVITERGTGIRRVIEVSVGANRRNYDRRRRNGRAHSNTDVDLRDSPPCARRDAKHGKSHHHDTEPQSHQGPPRWIGE